MQETTGLMNRGGIADLPLLGTLLAIFQRSWEPRFLEMMNSFALLPYATFAVSRTFLQQLLTCLNFAFYSEVYSVDTSKKSDLDELWQLHKQLKTMEMNDALPDTHDEGYTHQFHPEFTH